MTYSRMTNKLERQKLTLPQGHDKLLLHSCCAPCSGEVMETLIESGIEFSIFFYWDYNWRKHGGAMRMLEISKKEQFYQQEYCGCVYSLRDTNRWRMSQGRERIRLGVKFYSNAMDDES